MNKNDTFPKNWVPTANRFVCFLDILGFKDFVLKNPHTIILEKLKKIKDYEKLVFDTAELIGEKNDIKIVNFSDSFIIFSKNDSRDCFHSFFLLLENIFRNIIFEGFSVKGGAAYGKITVESSNNIFFGQPLIDAYLLQEDLNFLGIACHHSIEVYLRDQKIENYSFVKNILSTLKTPLKSGEINHLNLTWFDTENIKETDLNHPKNLLKNLYYTASGSPRKYLDNTEKVIDLYNKAKASD